MFEQAVRKATVDAVQEVYKRQRLTVTNGQDLGEKHDART